MLKNLIVPSQEFTTGVHMIIPAIVIIAVGAVALFGTIAATNESSPGQTNYLERRYNAQNGIPNVPQQNTTRQKTPSKEADMAVASVATPQVVSFTSVGKGYKTAAPCLTDAWIAGVRDEGELKKHCPGK